MTISTFCRILIINVTR